MVTLLRARLAVRHCRGANIVWLITCRERSDGHYRAITYLCAKMTMELLLAVPFSVISAALVFYLTRMSGSFIFFWVAYLVTIYVGIGAPLPMRMLLHALCKSSACLPARMLRKHTATAQHFGTCRRRMHVAVAGRKS